MATALIDADRFVKAKNFAFGTTAASGQASITINNGTAATSTVNLAVVGSQTIGGNLTVTGNFTVIGSITEQTVTNLLVTNKDIRVNVGGTTTGAAGAGLTVEGTTAATIGAIYYDATKASNFTIGNGTTQNEIVDVASSQTIINKTIAIASNTFTGSFSIANGGTGVGNLTANALIVGAGTSAVTFLVPGTTGNIIVSNGTNWISQAATVGTSFKRVAVTGTQDGVNLTFTLALAVGSGSEFCMIGQVPFVYGTGNNFTVSGTTLTFVSGSQPISTDIITFMGVC